MPRAQAVSLGHSLDVQSPAAGVVHSVFVHGRRQGSADAKVIAVAAPAGDDGYLAFARFYFTHRRDRVSA